MSCVMLLVVALGTTIVKGNLNTVIDNPSDLLVAVVPKHNHKIEDTQSAHAGGLYQLVPLADGRAGVRLTSACNRTDIGCYHTRPLNNSGRELQDRLEVAKGILFFTFDNTNNGNLLYSNYGAIIAKINDNVKFEKLSDQCMQGLVFTKGFVSLPHNNMKEKAMSRMSIVTWVKIDTLEHENTIYGCIGDDVMHHLEVKSQGSGSVGAVRWLYRPTRSETVFSVVTADVVRVGRWTHIAAVYDGDQGKMTIFVNGKDIYNDDRVKEVRKVSWDGKFLVGMYPVQRGTSPFYLEGSMDEFGIYAESFDQELVKQLMEKCDFNSGTEGLSLRYNFESIENKKIEDNSDNGYDGKVEGQLQLNKWTSRPCKHSLHFAQGKGYVHLLADGIYAQKSHSMTVSVWVRIDKVSRTNVVYGSYDNNLEKGYHFLAIGGKGAIDGPVKWKYVKDDEVVFDVRTGQAVSAGIWYHIAAMFDSDSGKVNIYQDGESIYDEKGEKRTGPILWGPLLSIGNMMVRGKMTKKQYFEGDMDTFEIYHKTLKEKRIQSLKTRCKFIKGRYLFLVTVQTGKKHFSSTKGTVYVKFYGEDKEFGEFHLYEAGSTRGRSKIYNIYGKDIGNLVKISVRKQDSLLSGKWFLEKITVVLEDRVSGPVFIFECNCWIGRNEQRFIEATRRLDGGWGAWSSWSGCGSGLCGGGKKVRSKSCTNPEPTGGGKDCQGDSHEEIQCPVDGGWGEWSPWSLCTKTCGGALVTRTRKCDNPEPMFGGKGCDIKDAKETKEDCTKPCETGPRDGQWSKWSKWSECSKTCGGGMVTRTRKCNKPKPARGGKKCPGESKETAQDCTDSCPIDGEWGKWGKWSQCSTTCGPGKKERRRKCNNPKPQFGGETCDGKKKKKQSCEIRNCPNAVNGNWGDWGEWSECSEETYCYRGDKTRKRKCNSPKPKEGGDKCPGTNTDTIECPKDNCVAVPENTEDSMEVDEDSELYYSCEAETGFLVSKSEDQSIKLILDSYFKNVAKYLSSGYFAVQKITQEGLNLTKICFEPDDMIPLATLKMLYPNINLLKMPPEFTMPDDDEHISTVVVVLKEDQSLYAGNFLLDSADEYSPKEFTMEAPEFYFQVKPDSQRIFAKGYKTVANADFLMEVTGIGKNEFQAKGESKESASATNVEAAIAKPSLEEDDDKTEEEKKKSEIDIDNLIGGLGGLGEGDGEEEGEGEEEEGEGEEEEDVGRKVTILKTSPTKKRSHVQKHPKLSKRRKQGVDRKVTNVKTSRTKQQSRTRKKRPKLTKRRKQNQRRSQSRHTRQMLDDSAADEDPGSQNLLDIEQNDDANHTDFKGADKFTFLDLIRRGRDQMFDSKENDQTFEWKNDSDQMFDSKDVDENFDSKDDDEKLDSKDKDDQTFERKDHDDGKMDSKKNDDQTFDSKENVDQTFHHKKSTTEASNSLKKPKYFHRRKIFRQYDDHKSNSVGNHSGSAMILYEEGKKTDKKGGAMGDFFEDLDIKEFIFSALKAAGLGFLRVHDMNMGIHVKDKQFMIRVTGVAKPIFFFQTRIKFEVVKNGVFGVGITADSADLAALTEKLFKKKINLFGKLREPAVGFCFAQEGFKITDTTKFTRDPLKSMINEVVTDGLFFGISAKLPNDCKDDTFCAFCVKLLGENTHLEFYSIIKKTMIKIAGRIVKRNEGSNKGKLRLSKIEIFMEIQFKLVPPVLGFTVELAIPVKGDAFKDGAIVKEGELYVGGTVKLTGLSLTGELYMDGAWTRAFGIPFLTVKNIKIGVTINLVQGIPEAFEFQGRVEIGTNCYGPDSFSHTGHCIGATALVGISVNPLEEYIYGELSALTIGKIFRMLGSKLQMPKLVDETGFREGLVVSAAMSDKVITYRSDKITVKRGLYIKGMVSIFGFNPSIEILLTDDTICFDAELEPIKLLGGVAIIRSLKDNVNGPKFLAKGTRKPLNAQIYIHGAMKIFGAETELMLNLTKEKIQAKFYLDLFSYLKTQVSISAGYGLSLKDTAFEAEVVIESHIEELVKNATASLRKKLEYARKKIEDAKVKVRDAKEACLKKAAQACSLCKRATHTDIQTECHKVMDAFKHFIGSAVDKFGGVLVKFGQKIKHAFTRSRTKRYMELLLHGGRKTKDVALYRRKRFISKLICDKLLGAAINAAKMLCEGSCSIVGHIVKGMCRALDLAQGALYLIERSAYWIYQALPHIAKNMLYVHKLSFLTRISPSIDNYINGSADVSIFQARAQFEFEINLANIAKSAADLALRALRYFIGLFTERLSESSYDNPSYKSDFQMSGEMKISTLETDKCLAVEGKGGTVVLKPCSDESTALNWAYTLTGSIMSIETGECLSFNKQMKSIELGECDIALSKQKFACEDNLFMPEDDTDLCLTEKEEGASLESCDNEELEDMQYWKLGDDSREVDVCEKYVPDIAYDKPAKQSSVSPFEDEETNERITPGADLAVDGDMTSSMSGGSCVMTQEEKNPWWMVDLQKEYIVTDISIVGEADDSMMMLENIETRVGKLQDKFWDNPMCGERLREVQSGEVWTSQCSPYIPGQYVSVQKIGTGKLVMCEVAVFARLDKKETCRSKVRRKRNEVAVYKPIIINPITNTCSKDNNRKH